MKIGGELSGANCQPGGELSGVNCQAGGELSGVNCQPGGELSRVNCPGGELSGVNCQPWGELSGYHSVCLSLSEIVKTQSVKDSVKIQKRNLKIGHRNSSS